MDLVESEVMGLLSTVLGVEVLPTSTRENVLTWDSLKHVEIIFLIEDEFGVELSQDDFERLVSVAAIVDLIKSHRCES